MYRKPQLKYQLFYLPFEKLKLKGGYSMWDAANQPTNRGTFETFTASEDKARIVWKSLAGLF